MDGVGLVDFVFCIGLGVVWIQLKRGLFMVWMVATGQI